MLNSKSHVRIKVKVKSIVAALRGEITMEKIINIHIEKLPEGVYLATSDEVQGLVAQGRTIQETLEIARDLARKLLEAQEEIELTPVANKFDYPLVVSS